MYYNPGFRALVAAVCLIMNLSLLHGQRSDMPFMAPAEVSVGDTIPADLLIYQPDGTALPLREVINGKVTVLVTGCLTCPVFHRTYTSTEAIYRDYRDREDIQFFYIYKSLAHPELNGYVQPVTLEERLKHIGEAKRVLGTTIPWLCDGVDNAVRRAFNLGPNSDMIISPDGKLIHGEKWTDSKVLRRKIISLVGDSSTHTSERDLRLATGEPHRRQRRYEQGVLERPEFSSELKPVKLIPVGTSTEEYYVKPRIEVDQNVLSKGKGEMYLGFFPDPIHGVHWNNLVDPVRYELILPDGMEIAPSEGAAPEVKRESDGDPREFKLQVISMDKSRSAELVFHYYACSETEGWCKPVSQKYLVAFVSDPDGGWTNGRSFRFQGTESRRQSLPSARPQRQPPAEQQNRTDPRQIRERILQSDQNADGRITMDELPQQMRQRFDMMDLNGDGHITEQEVDQMLRQRFGRRNGS